MEDLWMGIASRNPTKDCAQFQESHVEESPEQWLFPIHNPSSPDVVTNHELFLPKAILSGDIVDLCYLLRLLSWEIARMVRLISCVERQRFLFFKSLYFQQV